MDIVILCIKQNKKIDKFISDFYIEKIEEISGANEYCCDSYSIINSIDGDFYSVYTKESFERDNMLGGVIDIFDYNFASKPTYIIEDKNDAKYLKTIKNKRYKSLRFLNEKRDKFKIVLDNFLECSEIHTCVFLVRQQIESPEKICGPIKIDEFFELIDKNRIYMNIPYLVKK